MKLKKRIEENEKDINIFKDKIKEYDKEIKILKEEIREIKKCNKVNKSVIMKDNEFDMISKEIKKKLQKPVKELKKLYQATIDGDIGRMFHLKCDGIPNTLVLIKSVGNRRFGGFTSKKWSSPQNNGYSSERDENAFLFSLDKGKIYPKKNGNNVTSFFCDGPIFGEYNSCYDIYINDNCLREKRIYTKESNEKCHYEYNGDVNALSEDGKGNGNKALEYEVFQVILKDFTIDDE